ncbi:MAG: ATP-binding protein [Nitrososphaeria archaeon]
MRQLTVLSGKGGTGKTTIVASFAALAKKCVVADCDVDAPDLHLLLNPETLEVEDFRGSKLASIDYVKCIKCGQCQKNCRFNAISEDLKIDPFTCEGCGVCKIVCPKNAITLNERTSGKIYTSKTAYGYMIHALLYPGESNSGKLVSFVRQKARSFAAKEDLNIVLIDGAPGIGCPVIASITGVDVGIIVTEPTVSGIHDLVRALDLLGHFNIMPLVCINKYDLNTRKSEEIIEFCSRANVEVVGKISFDTIVTEAIVNGKPVIEYTPESNVAKEIHRIWDKVYSVLMKGD